MSLERGLEQDVIAVCSSSLPPKLLDRHKFFMRGAIIEGSKNPAAPFGAVIVNFDSGEVFGKGVNASHQNPNSHGEVAAINDYVSKQGNTGWENMSLYTTAEPCSMCMSAIAWAGIGRVVWASSYLLVRKAGFRHIDISAEELAIKAVEMYRPKELIGGVLAEETDLMLLNHT